MFQVLLACVTVLTCPCMGGITGGGEPDLILHKDHYGRFGISVRYDRRGYQQQPLIHHGGYRWWWETGNAGEVRFPLDPLWRNTVLPHLQKLHRLTTRTRIKAMLYIYLMDSLPLADRVKKVVEGLPIMEWHTLRHHVVTNANSRISSGFIDAGVDLKLYERCERPSFFH